MRYSLREHLEDLEETHVISIFQPDFESSSLLVMTIWSTLTIMIIILAYVYVFSLQLPF